MLFKQNVDSQYIQKYLVVYLVFYKVIKLKYEKIINSLYLNFNV